MLAGLDISHCSRLADRSLAAVSRLPLLSSLKLNGCVRTTDAGLGQLTVLKGVLLTLHLDKCIKITDAGVAKIAQVRQYTCVLAWA